LGDLIQDSGPNTAKVSSALANPSRAQRVSEPYAQRRVLLQPTGIVDLHLIVERQVRLGGVGRP
jgi:hypothetical protein